MAKCEREDILTAVAICAAPSFEFTLNLFIEDRWQGFFADWCRRMKGPFWHRRRVDWMDTESLFRAYIADGYQVPPIWSYKKQGGIKMSAPWEELLKCRLVMAGFSESETLNGYLPGRWYDYYTVCELYQAQTCKNEKFWRKFFYTESESAAMKGDINDGQ